MAQLVLSLKGRVLRRIPVRRITTKIGRDGGNDVVIDNPGVSRHHATIRYEQTGFVIHDAGSANGIFVNGSQVDRLALADEDLIQIGKFEIKFLAAGGLPPSQLADLDGVGDSAQAAAGGSANPLSTTALSPAELKKFMAEKAAQAAREAAGQDAAAEVSVTPAQKPIATPQPGNEADGSQASPLASRLQPPAGSNDAALERLERQAKLFRNVAIGLGVLVTVLVALAVGWYLLLGS